MAHRPAVSLTKLSLNLPWIGGVELAPDDTERRAAWALYVELVTRVAVQRLGAGDGSVRDAFESLYSLFGSTRAILRDAGPKVGASRDSVGGIAIRVLNDGLRPVLAEWHPRLLAHEATRAAHVSYVEHEQQWVHGAEVRAVLEALRGELADYAHALGVIAGVEDPRDDETLGATAPGRLG